MAGLYDADAVVRIGGDTSPLTQQLQGIFNKTYSLKVDSGGNNGGLGTISRDAENFEKSMSAANARVLAFGASVGALYTIQRAFTSILTSAIQVEKQITEINSVLQLSGKQLTNFTSSLFNIAKQTGSTFDEVAKGAVELSRQGLGVVETQKRLKDALIISRLSGLSLEQSIESVTSTLNSFNKEVLDSTQLLNTFAAVDQNFSISMGDIAKALTRVGSSAQDAGVNLNQILSLITTARQITGRSGEVIGTALSSVFTRIQRPQNQQFFNQIGIATQKDNGENRDAVSILRDLANAYGSLTNAQKSYATELLGGVRNINITKALLGDLGRQFSIYNQVLVSASGNTNLVNERNEKLNQTLSAQINSLRASATRTGATLGGAILEGAGANTAVQNITKILDSIGDPARANEAGVKFAKGLAEGVGQFLSGPGAILIGVATYKIVAELVRFSSIALKSLVGIRDALPQIIGQEKDAATAQSQVVDQLSKQPRILQDILDKQTRITAESRKQAELRSAIDTALKTPPPLPVSAIGFNANRVGNIAGNIGNLEREISVRTALESQRGNILGAQGGLQQQYANSMRLQQRARRDWERLGGGQGSLSSSAAMGARYVYEQRMGDTEAIATQLRGTNIALRSVQQQLDVVTQKEERLVAARKELAVVDQQVLDAEMKRATFDAQNTRARLNNFVYRPTLGERFGGFVNRNLLGITLGSSLASGVLSQYSGNPDDVSPRANMNRAAVRGLGDTLGYTSTGAIFGKAQGAIIGASYGLLDAGTRIYEASHNPYPQAQQNYETEQQNSNKLSDASSRYLMALEKRTELIQNDSSQSEINKQNQIIADILTEFSPTLANSISSETDLNKKRELLAQAYDEQATRLKSAEFTRNIAGEEQRRQQVYGTGAFGLLNRVYNAAGNINQYIQNDAGIGGRIYHYLSGGYARNALLPSQETLDQNNQASQYLFGDLTATNRKIAVRELGGNIAQGLNPVDRDKLNSLRGDEAIKYIQDAYRPLIEAFQNSGVGDQSLNKGFSNLQRGTLTEAQRGFAENVVQQLQGKQFVGGRQSVTNSILEQLNRQMSFWVQGIKETQQQQEKNSQGKLGYDPIAAQSQLAVSTRDLTQKYESQSYWLNSNLNVYKQNTQILEKFGVALDSSYQAAQSLYEIDTKNRIELETLNQKYEEAGLQIDKLNQQLKEGGVTSPEEETRVKNQISALEITRTGLRTQMNDSRDRQAYERGNQEQFNRFIKYIETFLNAPALNTLRSQQSVVGLSQQLLDAQRTQSALAFTGNYGIGPNKYEQNAIRYGNPYISDQDAARQDALERYDNTRLETEILKLEYDNAIKQAQINEYQYRRAQATIDESGNPRKELVRGQWRDVQYPDQDTYFRSYQALGQEAPIGHDTEGNSVFKSQVGGLMNPSTGGGYSINGRSRVSSAPRIIDYLNSQQALASTLAAQQNIVSLRGRLGGTTNSVERDQIQQEILNQQNVIKNNKEAVDNLTKSYQTQTDAQVKAAKAGDDWLKFLNDFGRQVAYGDARKAVASAVGGGATAAQLRPLLQAQAATGYQEGNVNNLGDYIESDVRGEFIRDYRDGFEQLGEITKTFITDFKSSFTDNLIAVTNGAKGAGTAVRDLGLALAQSLQKKATSALVDQTVGSLIGFATSATPGIGQSGLGSFLQSISHAAGGYIKGYSTGGTVIGGSGVKDDVPAVLNGGEYVIKKSIASKIGTRFLDALNNGGIPHFATGGAVYGSDTGAKYGYINTGSASAAGYSGGVNLDNILLNTNVTDVNQLYGKGLSEYAITQTALGRRQLDRIDQYQQWLRQNQKNYSNSNLFTSIFSHIGMALLQGALGGAGKGSGSYTVSGTNDSYAFDPNFTSSNIIPYQYGFADGGAAMGKDKIPALLTGGEYILTKEATGRLGRDWLDRLNSGSMDTKAIRRYNQGGYVASNGTIGGSSSQTNNNVSNTNNFGISINVQGGQANVDQSKDDSDTSGASQDQQKMEAARGFQQAVRAAVLDVVQRESRPNGYLSNLSRR